MKTTTFILALFILLKPITPVIGYLIFYEYVKTELCENKADIESSCNGKCFLKKQMANASESSDKNDDSKSFTSTFHFDFYNKDNLLRWQFFNIEIDKNKLIFFPSNLYTLLAPNSLFRPPIK